MVRYDENDKPNKYGYTLKQDRIWSLVNDERPLEEADFTPTDEDRAYYEECKWTFDLVNEGNRGKKKRVITFFND